MSYKNKSLVEDLNHFDVCHDRWMDRRNRRIEAPGYPPEWSDQQCMNCRYFIPLTGVFIDDYGACSNATSPFDGLVRFEHDGCDRFSEGDWWTQDAVQNSS